MSTDIVREPMNQWRLRESDDKDVVVVKEGTYGLPVLHRHGCRTRPAPDHPVLSADLLGFDVAEQVWLAEQARETAGLGRTIDLCVNCLCERV